MNPLFTIPLIYYQTQQQLKNVLNYWYHLFTSEAKNGKKVCVGVVPQRF